MRTRLKTKREENYLYIPKKPSKVNIELDKADLLRDLGKLLMDVPPAGKRAAPFSQVKRLTAAVSSSQINSES